MGDCAKSSVLLYEWDRMCKAEKDAEKGCANCPAFRYARQNGFKSCQEWFTRKPISAIIIIQRWSDSHPVEDPLTDKSNEYAERFNEMYWCEPPRFIKKHK